MAFVLLEATSVVPAVDELAVPVVLAVLFVMAVPEMLQSLAEKKSDWQMDWTINGISAAVKFLMCCI